MQFDSKKVTSDCVVCTSNSAVLIAGWKDALTVKFADGGNKKKTQYQARQWIDRGQEVCATCVTCNV